MKEAAPTLLPLLRTRSQGDILARIVLFPERQQSLTEIAAAVGVSPSTVMREVDRLAAAGLVSEERRGNVRLVRADRDNVVFAPLAQLMAVTFGPVPVLAQLLDGLPGVQEAFVYGSWAARYLGAAGAVPDDVDVLVVGDADLDALDDVAAGAARALGRDVSVRRVRPGVWADGDDPFLRTVRSRPMVRLVPQVG